MPKAAPTERPIHFVPTSRTANVIKRIQGTHRVWRGPFCRAAMDFVALKIDSGELVFTEHAIQPK